MKESLKALKELLISDLTPRTEIYRRIAELKQKMASHHVSFSVILQNVDLLYFTGTTQKGVLIVPLNSDPLFFVEKSLDRAALESPLEIIPVKGDRDIKNILVEKHILKGKGGMEFDVIPVIVYERWKSLLGADDMVDISRLIKEIRLVKSEFEIEQIKRSGKIISKVFEKAKEAIREDMREVDIAAIIESEGRIQGHQGFLRMRGLNQEMMNAYITHGYSATIHSAGDVPISGVGVTHAIPQGPSVNRVKRGIPLVIDYGGGYNGYITDETRTFVVGKLQDMFKKAFDVTREIVEDATEYGCEGKNGTDLYNRAFELVKRAKLEDFFMGYGEGKVSFIGHGLGLEINELPVITPRHSITLREGMVFAYEPKFIFPGKGAVGIEVDYIVRKDSLERVTDTSIDVVCV